MAAVIFPWPTRAQRRAEVQQARDMAAASRERARDARSLTEELHELRRKNHVQERLDYLIQRRAKGQGK